MPNRPLPIRDRLEIPASDLTWSYARSGGAGGQHVNTTDSRARCHFALRQCSVLSRSVKERLRAAHPAWCTNEGDLVLTSDQHRSRLRNIDAVRDRLAEAIRAALTPPRPRRPTRPTRSSQRRRVDKKKQRSKVKANRGRVRHDD